MMIMNKISHVQKRRRLIPCLELHFDQHTLRRLLLKRQSPEDFPLASTELYNTYIL